MKTTVLWLLGMAGISAAGCRAQPQASTPISVQTVEVRRALDDLLAVRADGFDDRAQRRALEALDAVPDGEVKAAYKPIERACLDGRGQRIAPLIHAFLDKLDRVSPGDARRAGERLLSRCGVYDWQPRESRVGLLRTAPRRFATKSETEVIRAVVAGAGG